jgi:hypothetical protein
VQTTTFHVLLVFFFVVDVVLLIVDLFHLLVRRIFLNSNIFIVLFLILISFITDGCSSKRFI